MRARVLVGVSVFVLVAFAPVPTPTQESEVGDLLVGTWQLDLSASKYRPGPPLRGETRIYTREPDGVKGVIRRTHADGREEVIEYMANTDREYMVTGTPDYDAIQLKQVDRYTSESRLFHGGNVWGMARRVIAPDGKSMTITFWRPSAEVHNIAVYVRK